MAKKENEEQKSDHRSGAEELGVYDNGQFVRSYSREIHGDGFDKLAEEFAAQTKTREVRKIR